MKIRDLPKKLPTFRDYTLDLRLNQIRQVNEKRHKIRFIEIDSKEGIKILKKYLNHLLDRK